MELINLLSKVVKENVNTKKVLLEYPESTVKKLVDKFKKETEDSEEDIRKNIADFERFKAAFSNEDKDIFRHEYEKIKQLIADKATKQKSKKDLDELVQDYIANWRGKFQVDLQLTKVNIKKFFEVKTLVKKAKAFSKDVTTFNPTELNELVGQYFSRFDRNGNNELVVAITEKYHKEVPDEDPLTVILPRAQRYVAQYNVIPLRTKLVAFMNFEEFEHVVDGYTRISEDEYSLPQIDTSDVDIAYEDDNILIFAPDQKHKCINIRKKFAPDRRWCTSWEGSSNYYYNYRLNQNLTLYYIINKNLPTSDLNYASVILVDRYGEMRLADGSNSGRFAGGTVVPWREIVGKIPPLEGKQQYLVGKPFNDEDQAKMQRYKSYNLKTTDPLTELGGPEEVELWMELRGPDFRNMNQGDEIFGNLPEELQKKYIGLGTELSAGMVRVLSPSAMSYYVSKKKEKLLVKSLKELSENDMEVVLSKEMRPYLRQLRIKYEEELEGGFDPGQVKLEYPNDANSKFARMFGIERLFELLPEDMTFFQMENKSKDDIIINLPDSFTRFKDLEILVLEKIVDKLPENIGELEQLSFVNITNCPKLTKVPQSIENCHCLEFLSFEGSGVKSGDLPSAMTRFVTSEEEDIYEIAYPPEMKQHCKMSS
jgi:hypothetical protein